MPEPEPRPGLAALPERLPIGRFELRPFEQRLLDGAQAVALGGRAFDLLIALVQRAGRVVPRNELIDAVWPRRVVEENNLSVQVNTLRKLLGSDVIVTVPGRGYRFVAVDGAMAPALATASDSGLAAVAASAAPAPTHLPAHQPLLIGRSEDLAALGTLVEQHRLVTLTGAGGIGKTRLAQALLQARQSLYPQGVCWVELGAIKQADALPAALTTALGVRRPPGEDAAGLAQALANWRMLLALDNAEHLAGGVAMLARTLLAAAPGVHLLVTSQVPLQLAEERVMRLHGLAVPQGPLPAQQAQAFGAVALFAERAQAVDSRFVLSDAQAPAVITLCRQLDGLALAIELAAARATLLGIDGLLASLDDRLRLLTGHRQRGSLARHQTLRASVAWSHSLLGAREQELFKRLAVLPGSAVLSMVQAIAVGAPGLDDEWAVLDALDELVQRSLVEVEVQVQVDSDGDQGAAAEAQRTRYRLLESPRALARELLADAGEVDTVAALHAAAVLQRLQAAERRLYAGELGVQDWQRGNELELDDALAGWAWAEREAAPQSQLALGAALLVALPAPLHRERLALADRIEPLIEHAADAALRHRAWSALSIALANLQQPRRHAASMRALAEARQLGTADPDGWLLYDALCDAAGQVIDDFQADTAQSLLDEALALENPAWPPVRRRAAARLAASIAATRGDAVSAHALHVRLLTLSRAAGDPSFITQLNLVDLELWAGQPQAAVDRGLALVAQLRDARHELLLTYARVNLAAAWLALSQTEPAAELLQATWPSVQRLHPAAWCIYYMALLSALRGRLSGAAMLVGAADAKLAARNGVRQRNQAAAYQRTLSLLEAALSPAELANLQRQGAALSDAEVERVVCDIVS